MAAVTLVGYRCALSLGSRGGRRLGRPGRAPDDHICQIRLPPPPSLHIRSQSIYIGEHWLKWGPNTIGLVHFWKFLHNFAIDGNQNFFDKLSAKKFSWIQSTKCCSRIVSGSTFGGQAATGPLARVQAEHNCPGFSTSLLPLSAQLWLSSLVTSGFLLLLPAQAATLTSCTGVSSSATECHVVPATETRPHGPSNCNWPPGPGSAHPAQATWQPELWLAVGDLYPHPAGLACHGPAWHMNGLAGRTYVSCHPSHQPSYSLAHYFCNMGNGSLNEVMNLNI